MGRLGDSLSNDDKQEYVNRLLKPGHVLFLHSRFTNPPKDKYLVIACWGSRPLLFVINSRIHPYIAARPHLSRCQIKLRAADYRFLDHDSYVNSSQVIAFFDQDEIRDQLLADTGRVKGELQKAAKDAIISAVSGAKTISPRDKKLIIDSLSL